MIRRVSTDLATLYAMRRRALPSSPCAVTDLVMDLAADLVEERDEHILERENARTYAAALQRCCELAARGIFIPPEIAEQAEYHAELLNEALLRRLTT